MGYIMDLRKIAQILKNNDIVLAIGLVVIVAMMILPLPAMILDLLLTINISLSVNKTSLETIELPKSLASLSFNEEKSPSTYTCVSILLSSGVISTILTSTFSSFSVILILSLFSVEYSYDVILIVSPECSQPIPVHSFRMQPA